MQLTCKPATTVDLQTLAHAFNTAFAGYFVQVDLTPQTMARRIWLDQIDLHRSFLLYANADIAGIALLAFRGDRCWLGGFGITEPFRGTAAAATLWTEAHKNSQNHKLTLEVLQQNEKAKNFYLRRGLQIRRDLLIMERNQTAKKQLRQEDPRKLLKNHFHDWHHTPPAWQRDLPALLTIDGLKGWTTPKAYALIRENNVVDLAAEDQEAAEELCAGLDGPLKLINEPEDSYFRPFFQETGRQHEMFIA